MTSLRTLIAATFAVSFVLCAPAAFAQSWRASRSRKKPAAARRRCKDAAAKEGQKKIDEIAEATKTLVGPAGNPECVWLGRRVVSLLWRDDLDTAFRHLDLYGPVRLPERHIQATFRCIVRQGNIDPKAPETLNGRVHACWLNPGLSPAPAAAANTQPPAGPEGTTTRQ